MSDPRGQRRGGAAETPDVVAPPPHHPRFPLFDGLRAIAACSIMLLHVAIFTHVQLKPLVGPLLARLNIGVTIFFLLSGFLLYRPFIAHRTGGAAAPRVPTYAKRRFLRIFPAYWLALTVLAIYPGLPGVFAGDGWAFYALLQEFPIYPGHDACTAPLTLDCGLWQTWSLVAELTFYTGLPLLVLMIARFADRARDTAAWMRRQLGVLGVLAAASVAFNTLIAFQAGVGYLNRTVLGTFLWFALGMSLAVLSVGLRGGIPSRGALGFVARNSWVPWAAAAAIYVAMCWDRGTSLVPLTTGAVIAEQVTYGVIAALLLLPAVFASGARGLPERLLSHRPVAWVGLISYGIFLWHMPIALELANSSLLGGSFLAVLVGTTALTFACAAASYYLVERPILRLKYERLGDVLRPRSRGRPAGAPTR